MMNESAILITAVAIVGAIGGALMFVGWLFTILTALGNKQYIFVIASFVILRRRVNAVSFTSKLLQ